MPVEPRSFWGPLLFSLPLLIQDLALVLVASGRFRIKLQNMARLPMVSLIGVAIKSFEVHLSFCLARRCSGPDDNGAVGEDVHHIDVTSDFAIKSL
jgi:hypothetical protein